MEGGCTSCDGEGSVGCGGCSSCVASGSVGCGGTRVTTGCSLVVVVVKWSLVLTRELTGGETGDEVPRGLEADEMTALRLVVVVVVTFG